MTRISRREQFERILKLEAADNLSAALRAAQKFTELFPRDPMGPYKEGYILHSMQRYDVALKRFNRALIADPKFYEAKLDKGITLAVLGRHEEAIDCYENALSDKTNYAAAYYNKGLSLVALKRFDVALENFKQAFSLEPTPYVHLNIALTLKELGFFSEAKKKLEKIITIFPDFAEAHLNLGNIYRKDKQLHAAMSSYQKAINLNPYFTKAYLNMGFVLSELKSYDEAIRAFRWVVDHETTESDAEYSSSLALAGMGEALAKLDRLDEALRTHQKALDKKNDDTDAAFSIAVTLSDLHKYEDAIIAYERSVRLNPEDPTAHFVGGYIFSAVGRLEDAENSYNKALTYKNDYHDARLNLSFIQLLRGQFKIGFENYEARKLCDDPYGTTNLKFPDLISINDISSQTVCVFTEQGLGDIIHFSRYLDLLVQRNAQVVCAARNSMINILKTINPKILVVDEEALDIKADFKIALMSLPRLFETRLEKIPVRVPYIFAESDRIGYWSKRIGLDGFRIGICWQGSAAKIDRGRSFSVRQFEEIAKIPSVRLISLHKGDGESQLTNLPSGMSVETLGEDFDAGPGAFLDTAAVMKNLDLVITSDTAVAHLAGALGVPVWIALQVIPDWRWMLERTDSPWYPTARLFRQKKRGDWDGVFADMKVALLEILARRA